MIAKPTLTSVITTGALVLASLLLLGRAAAAVDKDLSHKCRALLQDAARTSVLPAHSAQCAAG